MTSLKSFNRRVGSLFGVAALVLATVTPGLVPTFASAAQVTERSVELSSSSKTATDVSYAVTFKPVAATAGATVLNFCSNTPLAGATCDAPAGFTALAATTPTSGATIAATTADATHVNTVIVTKSIDNTAAVTLTLDHVTNPTDAGPLYVRIFTYDTEAHAQAYTATAYDVAGFTQDQGSAAASITDSVGVSAAVLETMTFCVAGNVINQTGCTTTDNSGVLKAPTLRLGETVGATSALVAGTLSQGSIYSQLSTNAVGGAVVNLKSGNDCGGLKRVGATTCDIVAANGAGGIVGGEAKFGVQVITGTDPSGASGTFQIADTATTPYYSDSVFKLNYVSGGASGVTSPFGDKLLDTNGGPANSKNAQINFGASINNQTPAGLYSNDFSLIATGKF